MDWRDRLAAYLRERLPAAEDVQIARVSTMSAGASNETLAVDLRVTCDGVASELPLVLRPQRRDGILAPYDIGRQFRVLRALTPTPVPVPPVAWHEPDPDVLGVPFFLMYRLRCETPPLFWYGPGERVDAAAAALAAVHAVDWGGRGLRFLAAEDGAPLPSPLACELPQWRARAERLRIARLPLLRRLERFLLAHEPDDARHALLHGDTNAGNYLFRGTEVVAVVDWELAAIGDPRADLGFYAALTTMLTGFPAEEGRTVLADAYARITGARLNALPFYEAWGLYRMIVIAGGWAGHGFGLYGSEAITHRLRELLGPGWERASPAPG